MREDFETVLQMTQAMIQNMARDEPVTRLAIQQALDAVLAINPRWRDSVDSHQVMSELQTRFSIWIGRERVLQSDVGHIPWLNAQRKKGARYWPRYREWLDQKWSPAAVDSLDSIADRVVGLLEDPQRPGPWDRRGLVVGHVQSGKTANYTGVIAKAADAGYKVLIVLAGMHKNLRSQTQMRLDEGFLGYETMPPTVASAGTRTIGVGLIDSDPSISPNYITNRSDNGDFNRTAANNLGINPEQRPLLFVIKKNGPVLRNLISWVEERVANARHPDSGRPVVENIPLLVIDDEADHASVDTGDQQFDQNGAPDLEYDPKTINRLIRRLLYTFEKAAYVGYTATPFANIYIHEQGQTAEEGEDLFPRSFIVNLPAASNYVGPGRLFGLAQGLEDEPGDPLPLIREIQDHAASLDVDETVGWMPPKHRIGHIPLVDGRDDLPESLKEALHSFVLGTAARKLREGDRIHSSMLVHVTRFNGVQAEVTRQIQEYFAGFRRQIVYGGSAEPAIANLERLWRDDFVATTQAVRGLTGDENLTQVSWNDVREKIVQICQDLEIRQINGSAGDILDYETRKTTGLTVLAVGGDKLSRGLTLEGLLVSYFLRASKMYDTLMQMGRWFGYRDSHLDLCRLYTSRDLAEWFEHVAEASEELRQEFDHMAAVGGTPREYGLKVRSHPLLMVTSRVKMRNATRLQLSFSGAIQETVVFHRDQVRVAQNLHTTEELLRAAGSAFTRNPTKTRPGAPHRWQDSYLWDAVSPAAVVTFLRAFRTHPAAIKVNAKALADFIEKKQAERELTSWTLALLSGSEDPSEIAGLPIKLVRRSPNQRSLSLDEQKREGRFIIRRLLAPRDEAIDLDEAQYRAALELTQRDFERNRGLSDESPAPTDPSGICIRQVRGLGMSSSAVEPHPERGLLLLYPLSPGPAEIEGNSPIVGFGISFPASKTATTVMYEVNNIYWQQEFEAGE